MAIQSYFYDSVGGDRPYSAADFANAFNMILENGVLPQVDGTLGLDIGGTGFTTIYAGRATVNGHFVEVIGTETLAIPPGNYSGQVVLRIDSNTDRKASIIIKTDRSPTQTATLYELPLYNIVVAAGAISGTPADIRVQGGAVAKTAPDVVTWKPSPSGVILNTGLYNGTGKPVILYLSSSQPQPSASEHRVWIQIEAF